MAKRLTQRQQKAQAAVGKAMRQMDADRQRQQQKAVEKPLYRKMRK